MKIRDILNAVAASNMTVADAESVLTEQLNAKRPDRTVIALSLPLGLGVLAFLGVWVHSCQSTAQVESQSATAKVQAELVYKEKTQACQNEAYNKGVEAAQKALVDLIQHYQLPPVKQ